MNKILKISFWCAVILAVFASGCGCMAGDYAGQYLLVAALVLPGLFIKARLYRIAALLLCFAYLAFAYEDHLAGQKRKAQMRFHQMQSRQGN